MVLNISLALSLAASFSQQDTWVGTAYSEMQPKSYVMWTFENHDPWNHLIVFNTGVHGWTEYCTEDNPPPVAGMLPSLRSADDDPPWSEEFAILFNDTWYEYNLVANDSLPPGWG
ncbi:MAG TPA: hypothetical protein VM328_00945, partial [Fimbriimonadaceae bacterium]|nr:hypothetical protein [Fimbriimonadaceae bacterium]